MSKPPIRAAWAILLGLLAGVNLLASALASPIPPQNLPQEPSPRVSVSPADPMGFPNAWGSHPQFPVEWWYITGHLHTAQGTPLGFQLTFFRLRPPQTWANPSAFTLRQMLFAQAAISDPHIGHLITAQARESSAFGLAGAERGQTNVWLNTWRLQRLSSGAYHAVVRSSELSYHLDIQPTQKVLLEGRQGISQKGPNPHNASYYYSQPHLQVRGTVRIHGQRQEVTGTAWLDHEWSVAYLPPQAVGWDWMGINLHDGGALMLFAMRNAQGHFLWLAGTWRDAQGRIHYLSPNAIQLRPTGWWQSPNTGIRYPIRWQVRAGSLQFALVPLMNNQEFRAQASTGSTYWEGAVTATHHGKSLGTGYLELTGYGSPLRMGR